LKPPAEETATGTDVPEGGDADVCPCISSTR
jgi:hypothetical protein